MLPRTHPRESSDPIGTITTVTGIGAYYLEDLDKKAVPRPWNVNNLKRYYY